MSIQSILEETAHTELTDFSRDICMYVYLDQELWQHQTHICFGLGILDMLMIYQPGHCLCPDSLESMTTDLSN